MAGWQAALRADPLDWLLEPGDPAVRHLALRQLCGRPGDDPDVAACRHAAMATDPIAAILAEQEPEGYWEKPGPGYATKYRGTVWQLIFLDQLGADPADARVQRACAYVLAHTQANNGGFGASGVAGAGKTRWPKSATTVTTASAGSSGSWSMPIDSNTDRTIGSNVAVAVMADPRSSAAKNTADDDGPRPFLMQPRSSDRLDG